MWLCLSDGFLSIVQVKDKPAWLVVRARIKRHLETFIGPRERKQIVRLDRRDYRWRIELSRERVTKLVADYMLALTYTNFKDSVKDDDLHAMYLLWWQDHHRMQTMDGLPKKEF